MSLSVGAKLGSYGIAEPLGVGGVGEILYTIKGK
jgi:hypothetical protein